MSSALLTFLQHSLRWMFVVYVTLVISHLLIQIFYADRNHRRSRRIVGLSGIGVSQDVAFAATISYRVSTFYLPPVWGWLAMHWLEKRRFI